MKLSDQVAIITGGGRGIGAAIAQAFVREGARVALAARTNAELDEVALQLEREGGQAIPIATDVSRREEVIRLVERTLAAYGHVDILVNAAGVLGAAGRLWQTDAEAWVQAVRINLVGTFYCCHTVIPHMVERRRGKIVNFSGGGATVPSPRFSAYGASKAAIVRLTETLAEELREFNVQANAIAPGPVATRMLDEGLAAADPADPADERARQVQERGTAGGGLELTAALAVFLASEEASGLTGRLIAAPHDGWQTWKQDRIVELMALPWFTLRRMDPVTIKPFIKKVQ